MTKAINVTLLKCWWSSINDFVFPYIIRMPTVTASEVNKLIPIFRGIYPVKMEWFENKINSSSKVTHNLVHWSTRTQHRLEIRY